MAKIITIQCEDCKTQYNIVEGKGKTKCKDCLSKITVKCLECDIEFVVATHWYGHQEICDDCNKERTLRNNCKRHLGRDGKDCYPCQLEGKF